MLKSKDFELKPPMRYGTTWPMFGVYWADGANAEIETEDSSGEVTQTFSVDDIQLEEKEEKEEQETEIEIEDEKKVSKEKDEVSELKKQIQELQQDLLKVATKKEPVAEKQGDKKEKLTRAQLAQILKEHKDNPEVVLNVIDYLAEQKAEETRDATMKDVNHRQWHSQLSGMANRILSEDEDGYLAANPKVKASLSEYATNLGMGDHPVGNLAAYAILRLNDKVKTSSEKVAKETKTEETKTSTKGKMDKTRLTMLQSKNSGLNQEQIDMAKRFGVKPETYAKFVGRKS